MIIVIEPDKKIRQRLAARLDGGVFEAATIGPASKVLAKREGVAAVVVTGPGVPATQALAFAQAHASDPTVSVVLVSGALTSDLLQAALRAGVRDVLPVDFTAEQVADAIGRADALARRAGTSVTAPVRESQAIVVFSPKGGVGKSFLAGNLAVMLAQDHPGEVALVDLGGDQAIMLRMFPERTIYEATQDLARLDEDSIEAYLTKHPSSLELLAAPQEPGLAETISADAIRRVVSLLKNAFPIVVVDSPSMFNDHVLAALDEATTCVLIGTMDVPSIKNLRLGLQTLQVLGLSRDRLRIVLNRADSKVGIRLSDVEKTLRTEIDVEIPSSREVPLAVNRGVALVTESPRSPVSRAIRKLAESLDRPPATQPATPELRLGRR